MEGERNISVRNIDWLPLLRTPRDQTRNLGTCPDQKLNQRPVALQDDAQPTEPHWSGAQGLFKIPVEYVKFTFIKIEENVAVGGYF